MCKYHRFNFTYEECGHGGWKTEWFNCEEAKARGGKHCEGKMAFPLEEGVSVPLFGSSRKKGWCDECAKKQVQK
jgi:hypothetical protein